MPERFKFGRTQSERTFPEITWDRRQSFLRRHDHDRDGEQRQGQRSPQNAASAEGGIRERLGKQPLVDRKFMHLGFHIYDVGFQSPNVEAAKPMVYMTTLILILVVVSLNWAAVRLRNRLRRRFAASAV